MQSVVHYLRQNAAVIVSVAVGIAVWPALLMYLEATTPKAPPRAQSLEDAIAYSGGCDEYLKVVHQADAEMDRTMREANLPGWHEGAAVRMAERRLKDLEALSVCRDMKTLEPEVAAGNK